MDREPSITIGSITAAVAAVLALLIAFGIDLTPGKQVAILGIVAAVGPLVAGAVTRSKVWAPANVVAAKVDGDFVAGPALPGIDDGKPVEVTPAL